jgi:predicted DNA-binding ribbon-helix-helix protein
MKKRSVTISGHRTSITLEQEFWDALKDIASAEKTSLSTLISQIDSAGKDQNLSSAIRLFVLKKLQQKS